MSPSSEKSIRIDVRWVPTDPHGPLPGHHWQGTVTRDGYVEHQRRYFKKWLALEDAQKWLAHWAEVEQEIAAMNEAAR